jgi:hypothetical protein
MKTKRIVSLPGSMLIFLMAALILLSTTGCEVDPVDPIEEPTRPEDPYCEYILAQNFWIHPWSGTVNLFDGAMEIVIPQGAVSKSTEFTMSTFSVLYLDWDGYNLYKRGFFLEGDYPEQMFPEGISFKIRYDMDERNWLKGFPAIEEDLQIYMVSPVPYAYERIVPVGECCVDCNCKTVESCISKCGFYVLGE